MLVKTLIYITLFILAGCAAPQSMQITQPIYIPPGIYHKVLPKETLWRISRAYQVSMEELARVNKLEDATKIQEGQLILIPGAKTEIDLNSASVPDSVKGDFIWPAKGKVVAFYGTRDQDILNKGIDIECPAGSDVAAAAKGTVSYANEAMKGYGKVVIIDHENDFSTVYAHNSQILVRTGQEVPQGFIIAKVGSTGRAKSPYLHFEIRKRHEPQNPFYYLP